MNNGPVTKYDASGNIIYGNPQDKPKQYTDGWVEFYKLKFKVTPDVLIPRPETELLVDEVLEWARQNPKINYPLKTHKEITKDKFNIIEIGTGSGCISISIAKNLPNSWIMASDISKPALPVARENAEKNKVDNIFFLESNLLSLFSPLQENSSNNPDIIVANLPYIPTGRISLLDPSVKDFEPFIALDGGFDGFALYRKLFSQIKEKGLKPKLIVCEIDDSHKFVAKEEAKKYFPDAEVEIKEDLAKKTRILKITL
jgi:release factor glutamine methyltransferase